MDDISLYPALVEIAQQLKGINRSLAILVGEPRQARHVVEPSKPNVIRSVALDGTVREVESP